MALPESDMADTSTAPVVRLPTPGHLPAHHAQTLRDRTVLLCDDGHNVLMTSIVFPLMVNGKVIASLSVDINLNSLQAISQSASKKLYDGQTAVSIISPVGLLAGYSPDASKLSQRLDAVDKTSGAELLRQLASTTNVSSLHSNGQLKVLSPFQPIPGGPSWAVLLDVPEKVLVERAEALKQQLDASNNTGTLIELGLGVLAALIGLLLVWLGGS